MFELLRPIFVLSVVSCVGGASISQAAPSSFSNEHHTVTSHTISDLASSVWTDLQSSMNKAWEKVKLFAGMKYTNKTIPDSMDKDSYPTQVTETTTTLPALQILSIEFTKNKTAVIQLQCFIICKHKPLSGTLYWLLQNDSFLLTNTVVATDETNSNECEELLLTCFTWRILKIVGTAVGVGFIISLFSPVLFYFIILNIGYLCYGIAFLFMALLCKADKGSQLGEKLLTACQEIGGSSLQNMFSPFPIFLTWLGSGCLIGWFIWPYF